MQLRKRRTEHVRDSQRSKVYTAEKEALRPDEVGQSGKSGNKSFQTIEEVEAYLRWLIQRAPIQRRYKRELYARVYLKAGKGAHATAHVITIPKWGRTMDVACHELAHVIIGRHYPRDNVQSHGREYCKVYLDLVRFGIGAEAEEALKQSFRRHRVKFTKATTRAVAPMTPEKREAMLERLEKARRVRCANARATRLVASSNAALSAGTDC